MGQIILNVSDVVTGAVSWTRTSYYDSNYDIKWYDSVTWRQQSNFGTRGFNSSRIPNMATVTSVTLSFNHRKESSLGGASYSYYQTQFHDTSTQATNTAIKNWLNDNKTETGFPDVSLDFIIIGSGGTGTITPSSATTYGFNATARVYNIKLVINYEIPNGIDGDGFSPISGLTFGYNFSPMNLLAGENTTGTYSFYGAGCYGFRVNYRPEGFDDYVAGDIISVTSGTSTEIRYNSMGYSDYSAFPNRATQMQVSFDFFTDSAQTIFTSTDWIDSGVYFLKERVAPVIQCIVTDTAGHLETYGRPIQNQSTLNYTFTFTPDEFSDATIVSKVAYIDGMEVEIANGAVVYPVTVAEGSTAQLLVQATDSYGFVTEEVYNINSYTYTVPKIDLFKVLRYVLVDGSPVFAGQGEFGALTLKASTASLGNQNSYSIEFSDGTTTTTLYSGQGNPNVNITNDITKIASYILDAEQVYTCSITITDDFNTVSKTCIVRKSGAPVLSVESYGVGFGKAPTGSTSNLTFDCDYPAILNQPVVFTNVTGINTLNFEGTEYVLRQDTAGAAGYITFIV